MKTTRNKSEKKGTQSSKVRTKTIFKGKKNKNLLLLIVALVALILVFAFLRFKYLVVPVSVNGQPLFIWEYLVEMHNTFGDQMLNQLIAKSLVEQKAKEQGVSVSSQEIDEEFTKLEEQIAAEGGIDEFLKSQGLTRAEVRKEIEINLVIQKLMADQISVSEEEVNQYFKDNQDIYEDISEEEAKAEIRVELKNKKYQQQVSQYLTELRVKAKVTINLPGYDEL